MSDEESFGNMGLTLKQSIASATASTRFSVLLMAVEEVILHAAEQAKPYPARPGSLLADPVITLPETSLSEFAVSITERKLSSRRLTTGWKIFAPLLQFSCKAKTPA
ncbi:hypothetical protein [Duffyella gerundensis]|uniref:hypothetical protein n=1 Tax=Duffyella TaxID=3026546 RepID=UPI003F6DEF35